VLLEVFIAHAVSAGPRPGSVGALNLLLICHPVNVNASMIAWLAFISSIAAVGAMVLH
jgi:hypothetical protein